jgi:chemotaxis protein methyltransferase CheR
MTEQELHDICKFMLEQTGVVLTSDKRYLVETRLQAVVREHRLASLSMVAREIRAGNLRLIASVIDALSTHETLFFRDKVPFEALQRTLLPALLERRGKQGPIRIWCAACSTGQEPYSIVMLLDELKQKGIAIEADILATDVSSRVIEQAKAGVFSQFEVQRGLPIKQLLASFQQDGTRWILKPSIASRVQFRQHNLLAAAPRGPRPFDIIFCRNALIYFADETRRAVLSRLHGSLADDGYLLLGSAETVLGSSAEFALHQAEQGVYVKRGMAEAVAGWAPRRPAVALAR